MFSTVLEKYSAIDTRNGTDKCTSHSYKEVYDKLFLKYKDTCRTLLEIGFDGGFSLQSYYEYFKKATICGIDIEDNRHQRIRDNHDIKVCIGDATREEYINYFPYSFDIIIEDASHLPEHQIQHFKDFSKHVKPGGVYIIEDINGENMDMVIRETMEIAQQSNFTWEVFDLRHIKNRFDDILIVFYKKTTEWDNITNLLYDTTAIEIGGPTLLFSNPDMLPLYHKFKYIDNINSTTFEVYENTRDVEQCKIFRNNFNMDATELDTSIIKEQYDACISSHTIEHIANPIRFLRNIKKLLKDDGIILSILPNKTEFWDRTREYTTMSHLIQDFLYNVNEHDLTHLEENYNTNHPWKQQYGLDKCRSLFENNFTVRGLHHHCFHKELVKDLHEYCGFKTIHCDVLACDPLQIVYIGSK